jgi:hypothetical protein
MKHIAWDEGVVSEEGAAMIAIAVGVYPTQKSIKTQCSKRVKMVDIDNKQPTCQQCIELVLEKERDMQEAFRSILDDTYTPEDQKDQIRNTILPHLADKIARLEGCVND